MASHWIRLIGGRLKWFAKIRNPVSERPCSNFTEVAEMMIEGAEFVADITGCSAWTTWRDGVVVLWIDRPPQYFTRGVSGQWNDEPVEPLDWPMDFCVTDNGHVVWRKGRA